MIRRGKLKPRAATTATEPHWEGRCVLGRPRFPALFLWRQGAVPSCTSVPKGWDPEGPGHGGCKGRAVVLNTAGLTSTVLACMVLTFGCRLFSRAGLPAPLCGALAAAHGGNKENGERPPKMLLRVRAGSARPSRSMSALEDWPPALRAMVHSPPQSWGCEKGKKVVQKDRKSRSWEHGASHQRGQMAFAPGCLQQRWGQPPSLPAELAPGLALWGCGG